jgi:hypothetical protein
MVHLLELILSASLIESETTFTAAIPKEFNVTIKTRVMVIVRNKIKSKLSVIFRIHMQGEVGCDSWN